MLFGACVDVIFCVWQAEVHKENAKCFIQVNPCIILRLFKSSFFSYKVPILALFLYKFSPVLPFFLRQFQSSFEPISFQI